MKRQRYRLRVRLRWGHPLLLTLGTTALAVALRWLGEPWMNHQHALVTVPAAVAAGVWFGGYRMGLVAMVVGLLACDYLFLGNPYGFGPYDAADVVGISEFLLASLIIVGFGHAMRAAQRSAVASEQVAARTLARASDAAEDSARLAAIVDTSGDAIVSKSLDGTIRTWNAAAEQLFGYPAAEAVGQSINLIVPEELREEEQDILRKLRAGIPVKHFQTERVARDGRRVIVSLSISPLRDAEGRIVGASKVARDITERQRTEAALGESEARFRDLANNIDQFAWTCDELGRGTWYNQRWYDYTGTDFETMRGTGWETVLHPDHASRVKAGLAEATRLGTPWEDTFPLRGRDGGYRWFLSRASPIRDERGNILRWFGTNTDITEQRELALQLEAADRRKDEFLATLAHELRNPLAPVRNALSLLDRSDDDPDTLTLARDVMERQLNHMVRLVDDLLDVSRITQDRLTLQRTAIELNALVASAVRDFVLDEEQAAPAIQVDTCKARLPLLADAVRIEQVLVNLLSNAARNTPADGTITVTTAMDGDAATLSVRDTGRGIPVDGIEEIFDMFAQAQDTDPDQRGLGIGLTLCKRLVDLHGGSIVARSSGIGQGSEFVVRLPLATASASPPPKSGGDSPPPADTDPGVQESAERRVLVVDDNADNADTMGALLRLIGYQTRIARDGESALTEALDFRPDVILLDLGLPGLDGLQACRELRRHPWGREATIIALTGWGRDSDRQQTAAAGFDHHLVKPVDTDQLLALLERAPTGAAGA